MKQIGNLVKLTRRDNFLTSTKPSTMENRLSRLVQSYPTYNDIAVAFNANIGNLLMNNVDKTYSTKAPTIGEIANAYGFDAAILWVKTQILTIDFYNSTKKEAEEAAMNELSSLIAYRYRNMHLTEFILFIARFKLGLYGKFYGAFDPIALGEALNKHSRDTAREFERAERDRLQREIENRRFTPPDGYSSLSWYQELKKRAQTGDIEAIEALKKP